MRALSIVSIAVASFAIAACDSTYHPEYHPVTVTSYEQHVTSPMVNGDVAAPGTTLGAQGATMSAPPPPPPPAVPPWSAWPSN